MKRMFCSLIRICSISRQPTESYGWILAATVTAKVATTTVRSAIFSAVMAADNFAGAFAGVALVTYMSSLTSIGYTATQYALLSSTYTYVGKLSKGFSGVMVESLASGRTLLDGYALFFIGCGLLGVPAFVLCLLLARATRQPELAPAET